MNKKNKNIKEFITEIENKEINEMQALMNLLYFVREHKLKTGIDNKINKFFKGKTLCYELVVYKDGVELSRKKIGKTNLP
jgi:hypothetical protein